MARGAGAKEVFDIVDQRGRVTERVIAPPRSRLIGFGRSAVYLVRLAPQAQEFVERYQLVGRDDH